MEQSEGLKEFSKKLKETREANGIDLSQVFEITRIDKKFLQALEEGDFDVMPEVYIKAFIKEYAEAIGLNGEETLKEYNMIKQGPLEENNIDTEQETDNLSSGTQQKQFIDSSVNEEDQLTGNKNQFQDKRVLTGIIILFILAAIIYFAFLKNDSTEIIKETPYTEIISKQDSTVKKNVKTSVENKTETVTGNKVNGSKLLLVVQGIDTSWVRISADGKLKGEFVIYPGIKKEFPAENNFNLLIGNSAGVELILNGKKLDFYKRKGRVRNLFITENGVKYIRLKKKTSNGK